MGAGVQGSSVALRLAQAGRRVVVLERAIPGAEASSAAGGILSPGVEALEPGPFYALCRASLARYPGFVARGGGVLRACRSGSARSARSRSRSTTTMRASSPARREAPAARAAGAGARRARRSGGSSPRLSPEARGALFFADEASLDPRPLARAVYVAASRAGATFVTGEVRRIGPRAAAPPASSTRSGRIDAGAVVLAAGSWSLLVEGHGLPPGAVRPVRGQIAVLDTRPPLLSRVVFSGHGYVVPRADGRVLCGSTMEEVGFEKAVTAGGLRHVLDVAIEHRAGARAGPGRRDLVELPAGEPRRRADPRRRHGARAPLRDRPHAERNPPRAGHRGRPRRRGHSALPARGPRAVLARAARRDPRLAVSRGRPRGRGGREGRLTDSSG